MNSYWTVKSKHALEKIIELLLVVISFESYYYIEFPKAVSSGCGFIFSHYFFKPLFSPFPLLNYLSNSIILKM
jgi:hypothetical protein